MASLADLERPSIPIAYLQVLVELLAERGIDAEALFAGIPKGAALLEQPDTRLSALQGLVLLGRAVALTDDPALGYAYGLRLRPTAHGFVGFAAVSSATVRDALELVVRYARVRNDQFRFVIEHEDEHTLLVFEETTHLPLPLTRMSIHEAFLLGIARGLAALLGRELSEIDALELWFDTPEPPYFRAWEHALPTMRFDAPSAAIRIPKAYLELRPVLADPVASRQAIALCERELQSSKILDDDVVDRVKAAWALEGGYARLEDVAQRLAMSTRTLARRLKERGTTYVSLLNERRESEARELLAGTELPVREIAERLGYDDPPSFTRAFTSWTGLTPSSYREEVRAGGAPPLPRPSTEADRLHPSEPP